jgi:C4-dicarboxylate-specific signal transduction histidine kinase
MRTDDKVKKQIDCEKKLIYQNRLAAMGEMIDIIAHQWRQPLANISGIFLNIERTFELKKLDEKYLSDKLIEADSLISNMSQTIDDFRDFLNSRKSKKSFDIVNAIKDIIKIFFKAKSVDIEFIEDRSYFLNGYEHEFKQVIVSILNNSMDIFDNTDIKDKKIYISILKDIKELSIIIEDNAGGIEEDIIDKIFDPYFTTKHELEGTGLGLYISKLIIENSMDGLINAENAEFGAKFIIRFKDEDLK